MQLVNPGVLDGTISLVKLDATVKSLLVPTGALQDFAGVTPPAGWLLCVGAPVSRVTYAALFATIGVAWGAGDGVTTFNLPDFRRRVAVGAGGVGTATLGNAIANVGGEEDHALSVVELASHNHSVTDPGHHHSTDAASGVGGASAFCLGIPTVGALAGNPSVTGVTINNTGSGTAHNTIQPSAVVTKIIKI